MELSSPQLQQDHSASRKLLSLFGAFLGALASGVNLAWGVESSYIKDFYSAEDVNTIGTMASVAGFLVIHVGIFFDKFGARASLIVAGSLNLVGWLLAFWGLTSHQPAVCIAIYKILSSQAVPFVLLSGLHNLHNFSIKRRGTVTAVIQAGAGLSPLLVTQLNVHVLPKPSDLGTFYLVMATCTSLLICLQLLLFAPPRNVQRPEHLRGQRRNHFRELSKNGDLYVFGTMIVIFSIGFNYVLVNINALVLASDTKSQTPLFVTAFAIFSVLGKLIVGFSQDYIPVSRAQLLAFIMFGLAIGLVLMGMQFMILAVTVYAFFDGGMWTVWLPLSLDVHGPENYGVTFATYSGLLGCGDVLVNFVFGRTFLPITKTIQIGDYGKVFVAAFVWAVLHIVGVFIALLLHRRMVRSSKKLSAESRGEDMDFSGSLYA